MPVKKATTAKKAPAKRKVSKGDSYVCETCGLSVIVDEECGCVEVHEILCCGKAMKQKKAKAKVKTAK
jgi:hypothetical protein